MDEVDRVGSDRFARRSFAVAHALLLFLWRQKKETDIPSRSLGKLQHICNDFAAYLSSSTPPPSLYLFPSATWAGFGPVLPATGRRSAPNLSRGEVKLVFSRRFQDGC